MKYRKTSKILFIITFFFLNVYADKGESIRKIEAFLLIDDATSAIREGKRALKKYGDSSDIKKVYLKSLSRGKKESEAIRVYHELKEGDEEIKNSRDILEEIAWGVLAKGCDSGQYGIRLTALVGAYLTQDVRAVKILRAMMRDSSAIVRAASVQLASDYGDQPLIDDISKMIKREKNWTVKTMLIQAIGKMRMKEESDTLRDILKNDRSTLEEKSLAIEALLRIHEDIDENEMRSLSKSPFSGLRELACVAALYLDKKEAKEYILPLIMDSNPDVRVAALIALAHVFRHDMSKEDVKPYLAEGLIDSDPTVAILAAQVALLCDPEMASSLEEWIYHENPTYRRFAAAALAQSGPNGKELSFLLMKKSFDPYVRANLAIGLIGMRKEREECSNILYTFLKENGKKWMWIPHKNTGVEVLGPSKVRYIDQVPNYPEAIDQMARLSLLSLLAVIDNERAKEGIYKFLQEKNWGITGLAAATLLQEGGEEALDIVRSLLDDPHPNVRLQAAFVLAFLGKDEKVTEFLEKSYENSDHQHKLHIIEAIGHIGKVESFPFLVRVLEEPFQNLRVAAASALVQCVHR